MVYSFNNFRDPLEAFDIFNDLTLRNPRDAVYNDLIEQTRDKIRSEPDQDGQYRILATYMVQIGRKLEMIPSELIMNSKSALNGISRQPTN